MRQGRRGLFFREGASRPFALRRPHHEATRGNTAPTAGTIGGDRRVLAGDAVALLFPAARRSRELERGCRGDALLLLPGSTGAEPEQHEGQQATAAASGWHRSRTGSELAL